MEDLSGGQAGGMTHDRLEDLVEARGRELKRQLLQDHLDLRALREEQALPAEGEARRVEGRGRVERGHERGLATVSGRVTVRRLAFRAPGRVNVYPADALSSGWPIATGVIEGACRHLIGGRLDIAGSRWGVEGAEAILRLRAVIDNGDFEATGISPALRA